MVDYVELQYANMLSNRLERYKIKSTNPYKINFRCPFCGDSKKSAVKSRGWLLENYKTQQLGFYCYNCFKPLTFRNFLKELDTLLYNDFVAAKYLNNNAASSETKIDEAAFKTETPAFDQSILKKLKKVSQLEHDHPVKLYVQERQIPSKQHYRLYYAPKFVAWVNSIVPGKLDLKEHPRLIIPLKDKEGICFGISARAFDKSAMRYMTILFQEKPKIFGLDEVNFSKDYIIVEGALDSLFLENSIAMTGADGSMNGLEHTENAVWCFDNEPRNKEIHARIEKLIQKNQRICIWPSNVEQKDINDMHIAGVKNIQDIIMKNTYKGLQAKLRLAEWRKT